MEELLEKNTNAILSWIKSSETEEHFTLLLEAIVTFIIQRFEGKVDPQKISDAKDMLLDVMHNRKIEIIAENIIFKPKKQTEIDNPI